MSIFVTRSSMPDYQEYCDEIKDLWDSRFLTNCGPKHQKFEKLLEEKFDIPCVQLYTNGHLALEHYLQACNFPEGSEIITTPFTFVSTTNAIIRSGMKPVFCDIALPQYTMDPEKIEELITDKTVAILPVHVYGNICDVDAIQEIADRHNLKVIYDAAHAFNVEYNGKSIVHYGDASMFSFHATKVFNTIEGGALCFKDESMDTLLAQLRGFGITGPDTIGYAGGNAKMNEFQAAMGLCNLRHLDDNIADRKKAVERYRENLKDIPGIILCPVQENVVSNYAYFPVVFDGYKNGSVNRDTVAAKLAENDIFARKYFYPLTNDSDYCSEYKNSGADSTPIAKHISENVLTLPLYSELTIADVDRICEIIKNI